MAITFSQQINPDGTTSDIYFIADDPEGLYSIFTKESPLYQAYLAYVANGNQTPTAQ